MAQVRASVAEKLKALPPVVGPPGLAPSGACVAASPQFGVTNRTDVFLINQTGTNAPGWPMAFRIDAPNDAWVGPNALVTEI